MYFFHSMEESDKFSWVLMRKHQLEVPEDKCLLALGFWRSTLCSLAPFAPDLSTHRYICMMLLTAPTTAVPTLDSSWCHLSASYAPEETLSSEVRSDGYMAILWLYCQVVKSGIVTLQIWSIHLSNKQKKKVSIGLLHYSSPQYKIIFFSASFLDLNDCPTICQTLMIVKMNTIF